MNFSIFRIKSTTKNIAIKQHIYYFYSQRCIFGWIFCIVKLHPSKSTKNKIKYNPAIHVCVCRQRQTNIFLKLRFCVTWQHVTNNLRCIYCIMQWNYLLQTSEYRWPLSIALKTWIQLKIVTTLNYMFIVHSNDSCRRK